MKDPDLNFFNLDEDGEQDDLDYSECINTLTGLEEEADNE